MLRDEVLKGYQQQKKAGLSMWKALKPSHRNMRVWQALVLVLFLLAWHLATRNPQAAFFFGEPLEGGDADLAVVSVAPAARGRHRR